MHVYVHYGQAQASFFISSERLEYCLVRHHPFCYMVLLTLPQPQLCVNCCHFLSAVFLLFWWVVGLSDCGGEQMRVKGSTEHQQLHRFCKQLKPTHTFLLHHLCQVLATAFACNHSYLPVTKLFLCWLERSSGAKMRLSLSELGTKFQDWLDSQYVHIGCCPFKVNPHKRSLCRQGGVTPIVECVWREVWPSKTTKIQKCLHKL